MIQMREVKIGLLIMILTVLLMVIVIGRDQQSFVLMIELWERIFMLLTLSKEEGTDSPFSIILLVLLVGERYR